MANEYSFEGIMAAIARGAINEAISNLKEHSHHLTAEDKNELLTLMQLQNHI